MADLLHQTDRWLADQLRNGLRPALNDRLTWFRGLKAICEIAFFVSMNPGCHAEDLVTAVDECLFDLWTNGKLLCLTRHNLDHANLFLPLLLSCESRLELDRSSRADIRHLASLCLKNTKERLPYRQLDLLHSAWKITGSMRLANRMNGIARYGCLRKMANIATITPSDDYAITHTIFYLTDFGRRPWPMNLATLGDVDTILWSLSNHKNNHNNFDILAEFLLARIYLGINPSKLAKEIAALWKARSGDGVWIGPADLTEKLKSEGAAERLWPFLLNYHTTLVCREALAVSKGEPAVDARQISKRAGAVNIATDSTSTMETVDDLIRAYKALVDRRIQIISDDTLSDPTTILNAVEWHLLRSAIFAEPACESDALKLLASTDGMIAWSDLRLARIVLSAGIASYGEEFLRNHDSNIRCFCRCVLEREPIELSVDEACILALIHLGQDEIPILVAEQILRSLVDRFIGELDIVGAVQVGVLGSLFGNGLLTRKLDYFVDSYRSSSVLPGYLVDEGDQNRMLAANIKISMLQYQCIKHVRGATASSALGESRKRLHSAIV